MNTAAIRELLSKATPRPWVVDGTVALALSSIDRNDAMYISVPRAVRNAVLIVALVNNAETLLEILEHAKDCDYHAEWCPSRYERPEGCTCGIDHVQTLIQKWEES